MKHNWEWQGDLKSLQFLPISVHYLLQNQFSHTFLGMIWVWSERRELPVLKKKKIGPRPICLYLLNYSVLNLYEWRLEKIALAINKCKTKKLNTNLQQICYTRDIY